MQAIVLAFAAQSFMLDNVAYLLRQVSQEGYTTLLSLATRQALRHCLLRLWTAG